MENCNETPVNKGRATEEDKKRLIPLIEELKKYQNLEKEAKEIIESLKDELKAEMGERGVDELEVGTYRMHYTDCLRTDFDTEEFKKRYPRLFKKYVISKPYKRFSVN